MIKSNDTKTAESLPDQAISEDNESEARRMSPATYDELYIQSYLEHPEQGKVAALRAAGHPNPTRQRAWQIHSRLEQDIDKRLDKLIMQDAALGRSVLVQLAKTASSDSVKSTCATKLMEFAGKQRPDRLIVENRTPDDIDAEIAAVQKRILEAQGEDIPESELH